MSKENQVRWTITFGKEDADRIESVAKIYGLSVSSYVRFAALKDARSLMEVNRA